MSTAPHEAVQMVVSSLARRLRLSAHRLGTRWLRLMDFGARVAMSYHDGLVVDVILARASTLVDLEKDSKFPQTLNVKWRCAAPDRQPVAVGVRTCIE